MPSSSRSLWLPLAVLGAALLMLLWTAPWANEPAAPANAAGGGAATEDPLALRGTEGTTPTDAPAPDEPEEDDAEEDPPYAGPVAVGGWIEVSVDCADVPVHTAYAHAYALDAGSAGSESWVLVPHASVVVNGEPERIPVPRPGSYDIGCACDWGQAMLHDVVVEAGQTVQVRLALPAPGAIRVRLLGTWPLGADVKARARVDLTPVDGAPRGRTAPGRGELVQPLCSCPIHRELQGVRAPVGVMYRPQAVVVTPRSEAAVQVTRFEPGPYLEPAAVRDDQEVRVRFPPLTPIQLKLIHDDTWPSGERSDITLTCVGEGWTVRYHLYQERSLPDHVARRKGPLMLEVPPGPFRVVWGGRQIAAGEAGPVEASGLQGLPVEVPLAFDVAALDGREPLAVQVSSPGPWHVGHLHVWGGKDLRRVRTRFPVWRERADQSLPASVRRDFTHAMGVAMPDLVTDAVRLPATGDLQLRFREGGFLQIKLPDGAYPAKLGPLTLRRTDGVPLVSGSDISGDMAVSDDERVGPLAPGPHTLGLYLAGRRIQVYEVEVTTGLPTLLDLTPR